MSLNRTGLVADYGSSSESENEEMSVDSDMAGSANKSCIITDCERPSEHIMCSEHLDCLVPDSFEILPGVKIYPSTPRENNQSKNVKLAHALIGTSAMRICSGKKKKRISKAITEQAQWNAANLTVIELDEKGDRQDVGKYFSDDNQEGCISSREFQQFRPQKKRSLLAISKETREIIFFIPDPETFDAKSQAKIKQQILKTFRYQPAINNKQATRRRIDTDKWVFKFMKWSSFENPKCGPQVGVTSYKPIKKYQGVQQMNDHELSLTKELKKMTKKFKPLVSVLKRHENVTNLLNPSSKNQYAAALGR